MVHPHKVRLVFDRGFARPAIIEDLAKVPVIFYVRIKNSKKVMYQGNRLSAKEFSAGVYRVHAYELDLSLTVTPLPSRRKGKKLEPWYIISNDPEASADAIQSVYYYRFEIEELFRDAKRMFGLEYIHFTKPDNFATVLWFVIAGMWFHAYLEDHLHKAKTEIKKCKQSFNQSITHYWLEQIRYALQAPALALISIPDG